MHHIRCSEIWGGIRDADVDMCTSSICASLYSSSCDGGKGGDVYYLSVCDSDLLTRIAVADVAGHGKKVSDVSQWLFDSLKQRMNSAEGHKVLEDLNRLADEYGYKALTTATVVAYYLSDSKLYFAHAGHPPLLVRRQTDTEWHPAEVEAASGTADMPLGVDPAAPYTQQVMAFSPGDRVFLYTDGVTEAPDAAAQRFGAQRLLDVLNKAAGEDLPGLKDAVLEALRKHSGGSLGHDDVTLMAIEVT